MGVPGIDYLDDNAAEALALYPRMFGRCRDCAYTVGTDAWMTPVTRRLAVECSNSRHAFWCHKSSAEWWGRHSHLCAGWVESLGG